MGSDRDALKRRLLALMQQPNFMPMRKRGLAKRLKIEDEIYPDFRRMVEDLADNGEIAELKKGKFGLPRGDNDAKAGKRGKGGGGALPKNTRVGRIDIKRAMAKVGLLVLVGLVLVAFGLDVWKLLD